MRWLVDLAVSMTEIDVQQTFAAEALRAANTTQQTKGLRSRRGVKLQAVQKYDKAKQRRIKGGVSGSNDGNGPITPLHIA